MQLTAKLCRNHFQLLSYFHEQNGNRNFFLNKTAARRNIVCCELCVMILKAPINEVDDIGMTHLMIACERNHLDIVSFLTKCCLAVNVNMSQKYTALYVAAKFGNTDLLEVLVNEITEI